MTNKNLQPVLTELHAAFDKFNERYYEGKLPQVVIAIRSQGKREGVLGWFTPSKVWSDGTEDKHEIVITAETLNRSWVQILQTLHHEMIHLYCETNGIQDTSRQGKYHNKRFRDEACKRGFEHLNEKPDSKIGWSFITLTDETVKEISEWGINPEVFGVVRKTFGGPEKKKKKSNIIKWTCPACGCVMRSSKLVGVKPYCMNDLEADGKTIKDPCASYFEPELPEGFIGKTGEDETPVTPEGLTDKETAVLNFMMDYLKGYDYSFTDMNLSDITGGLGWSNATAKGVIGSLVKKDYVDVETVNDEETFYGLSFKTRDEFNWSEEVEEEAVKEVEVVAAVEQTKPVIQFEYNNNPIRYNTKLCPSCPFFTGETCKIQVSTVEYSNAVQNIFEERALLKDDPFQRKPQCDRFTQAQNPKMVYRLKEEKNLEA